MKLPIVSDQHPKLPLSTSLPKITTQSAVVWPQPDWISLANQYHHRTNTLKPTSITLNHNPIYYVWAVVVGDGVGEGRLRVVDPWWFIEGIVLVVGWVCVSDPLTRQSLCISRVYQKSLWDGVWCRVQVFVRGICWRIQRGLLIRTRYVSEKMVVAGRSLLIVGSSEQTWDFLRWSSQPTIGSYGAVL